MLPIHEIYLALLQEGLSGNAASEKMSSCVSEENSSELAHLALTHCTAPLVLPAFSGMSIYPLLKQKSAQMLLDYYQMEHFTQKTVELLSQANIPYYLMKGISLADAYPEAAYRKLGDLDLYINNKAAFRKAEEILKANGYLPEKEDELSSHHTTWTYLVPATGRRFLLELHFAVVGDYQYAPANQILDSLFSEENLAAEALTIRGYTYRCFPPTENVFYMLHHILKHFLYQGFGIRLLLDFTLYLEKYHDRIDFASIHRWCAASHILHFYELVLVACRTHLGLSPEIDRNITCSEATVAEFLTRILNNQDMGAASSTGLIPSHSYKKITWISYLKEGHTQMKVRFPSASRIVLLWPILWGLTLVCFLWNTYTLRHTSFSQTLKDFQAKNEESRMIRIFDNSDE